MARALFHHIGEATGSDLMTEVQRFRIEPTSHVLRISEHGITEDHLWCDIRSITAG